MCAARAVRELKRARTPTVLGMLACVRFITIRCVRICLCMCVCVCAHMRVYVCCPGARRVSPLFPGLGHLGLWLGSHPKSTCFMPCIPGHLPHVCALTMSRHAHVMGVRTRHAACGAQLKTIEDHRRTTLLRVQAPQAAHAAHAHTASSAGTAAHPAHALPAFLMRSARADHLPDVP